MHMMMMAESSGTEQSVSAVSSSHVGKQLEILGRGLPNPDGTAMTSEIAWEDCEQEGQGEAQLETNVVSREVFNRIIYDNNRRARETGHPSQVMEPVLGSPLPCDEYGNRYDRMAKVPTISSADDSSLSPPPTTNYGGSEIAFPSCTPRERVQSPLPATNHEGSLLGLPLSALPQDPFSTPRVHQQKVKLVSENEPHAPILLHILHK